MLARTHCRDGHELTPDNRIKLAQCLTCIRHKDKLKQRRHKPQVTQPCGVVSYLGNPCQRQIGHDGRHHGQRYAHKLQVD
jgi:hypothetical protein